MNTTPSNASRRSSVGPLVALGVTIAATVAGGLLYGKYSQRWGPPPDLQAAGTHVENLPKTIGDWQLAEEQKMTDSVVQMLECAGHVQRRYVNRKNGQEVTVALIVGPPGPTAVHTPEICYSSRAYDLHGERQSVSLNDSSPDTFWAVDFETRNVMAGKLRVYYAWSDGGPWKASESPRYEYAASPMLYKIQLSTDVAPHLREETRDAGRDFLEQLQRSEWRTGQGT